MKKLKITRLRILIITTLLLVISITGTCITTYAITNGQPDLDGHPYVCLIVFDVYIPDDGNVPAWRASGVLISPTVVLTAGHATDGAVAARVWFDYDIKVVPDYPEGGIVAIEGTPYTNPDFCIGCGPGLPGFDYRDVGVVILDEPVENGMYGELPTAGFTDSLPPMTDVDLVGYGVQWQDRGGGVRPRQAWKWNGERYYAPAQLLGSNHVHSDEFLKCTANPGQGKGGTSFGDSGGPVLLRGTNLILAVNSYVTNANCGGVTYHSRIDIQEVLNWINSFLP